MVSSPINPPIFCVKFRSVSSAVLTYLPATRTSGSGTLVGTGRAAVGRLTTRQRIVSNPSPWQKTARVVPCTKMKRPPLSSTTGGVIIVDNEPP